jgi:membrane protein DedA with SNARE-associated domain
VRLGLIGALAAVTSGVLGVDLSSNLGYVAVGLIIGFESMGVPLPGETALVVAALAASRGKLEIVTVIVIASVAAIIGDNTGYLIGRLGGRKLLETPRGPFHERRLKLIAYGDRFFDRHGGKTVFIGRWIGVMRIVAAWMAGANRMPARRFFVFNALGGITWATSVGLAAYFLGEAGGRLFKTIGLAGAVVVGAALIAGLLWLRRRERRALNEAD